MNMISKIKCAQAAGANVAVNGTKLGHYKVTMESLQPTLERLYHTLGNLGCTYEGGEPAFVQERFGYLADNIPLTLTDNPVYVMVVPEMGGTKYEYHEAWRLAGWSIPNIGDENDLVLVNVGAMDAIEVWITGVKGKRLQRAEAAIKRVFGDTYG